MGFNRITFFCPSCNIKLTKQGKVVVRARLSRDLANGPGIGGATQRMPPAFYFWTLWALSSRGLWFTIPNPFIPEQGWRSPISCLRAALGIDPPAEPSQPAFCTLANLLHSAPAALNLLPSKSILAGCQRAHQMAALALRMPFALKKR